MPVKNPSAPYLYNMLREEYIVVNRNTNCTVKGVLLYKKKEDLLEMRRGKVLAIFQVYSNRFGFSKRSQRTFWKDLITNKHNNNQSRIIQVDICKEGDFEEDPFILEMIISKDIEINENEVCSLLLNLGEHEKKLFNDFYE